MRYFIKNYIKVKNKGFTLVELVAVMIIIGFIMAIALPRFFSRQTYEGKGYYEKALNLFYFSQKVALARGAMPYEINNAINLSVDSTNTSPLFYGRTTPSKEVNEAYTKDVYVYIKPKTVATDENSGSIETFFADRYNSNCSTKNPSLFTISDFPDAKPVKPVSGGLSADETNDDISFKIKPTHTADIEELKIQYLKYQINAITNRWEYILDTSAMPPQVIKFDAQGQIRDACNNILSSNKIIDLAFKIEAGSRGSYYHVILEPITGYVHPGHFNSPDNTYENQTKCKVTTGGKNLICTP